MPFMAGTLPYTLYYYVKGLEKKALTYMERCANALDGTGTGPNAALTRWFGDTSAPFRKEMKLKIRKMRSMLNAQSIECTSSVRGGDATENASSTFTPGGIYGGTGASRVAKVTDTTGSIEISPNFKNLPETALGAAASWNGQDKLETLLHELSHYVHDTDDEPLNDGTDAYEAQNARLLATQNVARAKNNAENWGFFIEELGA